MNNILIAGGGIGGLAAALACRQAGCTVHLMEQASVFSEVGAGLQLGPNAVRVLDQWGLAKPARALGARPERLQVLSADDGRELGRLRLGDHFAQRYGADYLTFHRADLHQILLQAAQQAGVELQLNAVVRNAAEQGDYVQAQTTDGALHKGAALVACDGVWSGLRHRLLHDGRPVATGHVAFRTIIDPSDLPADMPQDQVTIWLAERMHAVAYPVRAGALFNLVVIVEGSHAGDPEDWNHLTTSEKLLTAASNKHSLLQNLINSAPDWRLWALHDRDPLTGPHQMAQGRIALLGDASHAMRPYLAQGAAMALEDAFQLGRSLAELPADVPTALAQYANVRWRRNAWVQQRSRRNGVIFHASGALRLARNLAMQIGRERLLELPRLYGARPELR